MKTEEKTMSKTGDGKIGLWAVVALGVGGMVGGGIFAVQLAHGGTPVAFALAAMVALAVIIEGSYRLTKREIRLHE